MLRSADGHNMWDYKQQLAEEDGVPLASVAYYFDAAERDRIDANGASRRAAELAILRERLLKLSDEAFELAIRTIRNVVSDADRDGNKDAQAEANATKKRLGSELYERSTGRAVGGSGVTQKITAS